MDETNHTEREKKQVTGVEIFLALLIPGIFCGPFIYLFIACYIDSQMTGFLVLSVLSVGLYAGFVYSLIKDSRKGGSTKVHSSRSKDEELSTSTKLMLGAMGARMIDKQLQKEKRRSDQRRQETFFWQDHIRQKGHSDDLFSD